MVETTIYFLIGFLVASLLALAAAPAISRRATRLAVARARLLSPLSETQARAERDALRGQHAVEINRMEQRIRTVEDSRASALAELGRRATQIVHLEELSAERAAEIARQRQELADLEARWRDMSAQAGALEVGVRDMSAQRDVAHEAWRVARERVTALETTVDEHRAVIASLETRAAGLDAELASARRAASLAAKAAETERARLEAALRERIQSVEALGGELASAKADISALRADVEAGRDEAGELKRRLARVEPLLSRSEAAREELAMENSRQLAKIAERDAALEQLGGADARKENARLREQLAEAVAAVQSMSKGDQELRQVIARLGREIARTHDNDSQSGSARVVNFARWEPMVAGHGHAAGQSLESTAASER